MINNKKKRKNVLIPKVSKEIIGERGAKQGHR